MEWPARYYINEMRQVIKMPNDSSDSPWSDTLTHSLLLKYFLGYNLKKDLKNFVSCKDYELREY